MLEIHIVQVHTENTHPYINGDRHDNNKTLRWATSDSPGYGFVGSSLVRRSKMARGADVDENDNWLGIGCTSSLINRLFKRGRLDHRQNKQSVCKNTLYNEGISLIDG